MKTLMFPGQGSQARGMGGTLFDEFSELTERADQVLGYSIKELCLADSRGVLNKTQFTQPALYVVNALSYYKKIKESDIKPDFLAGHSLGEFNALMAGECFDFETGLRLVKRRGELMSQVSNGGMAAVVNASKEEIQSILERNALFNIDIANYNTPSQIVISGSIDEIGRAQAFFQEGRMLYYPLNTSGAFHSRFMRAAKEEFRAYLKTVQFAPLKIPVISNVTARPYEDAEILDNLANQMASTVRWSESIQYLIGLGAGAAGSMQFEEVGHGDVLTKLVHTIKRLGARVSNDRSELGDGALAASAAAPPATGSEPIKVRDWAPKKYPEAGEKAAAWNQEYSIGTRVKSSLPDYADLETRTEAIVLFGHRAAVYMKGYNGYFDLDEIAPL
jgi:malonyl CoA-acyl carrier protein transacylase